MEEFRIALAETINSAQLPFEAKVYVLRDIVHEVEAVYKQELERKRAKAESEVANNGLSETDMG